MWKRVLVMIIALVATFGVVLKLNQNIMALSPYKSDGAVTGRVIMAPTGVANEEHALKKGDRIATDVINWQLIENTTYTDYGCNNAFSSCPAKPAITAWLAFTTTSYGKTSFVPNNNVYTAIVDASDDGSLKFSHQQIGVNAVNFSSTNLYNATLQLDAAMKSSNQVSKIIAARDLTKVHQAIQDVQSYKDGTDTYLQNLLLRTFAEYDSISRQNLFGANVIPFHFAEQVLTVPSSMTGGRSSSDLAFTENYWTAMGWDNNSSDEGRMVVSNGMHEWKSPASSAELATRNAVYFDLSKVVFAVSQGTTNEISTVTKPNLPSDYTNITNDAIGSPMKLRILNTAMTAELHSIKKVNGQELHKEGKQYHIAENRTVLLDASANSFQGSTLSVILFDEANNFKYYQPLEAAKGKGTYSFSTKGIAPGNYKIAIVNEVYNGSILEPADSSLLSSTLSLKITNAVPMDYQENSESYEYTINVNVKDNIGSLDFQNDILPQGISIKSSTTGGSEHANDYLNFNLTSTSIASIYDVSIKEKDAPDVRSGSLQAGDYYFRIEATDGNADIPVILFEEVKLTVNKTDSTLSFSSPDIKELKIGSAPLSKSVVTNNTDILTSTDVNFTLNEGVDGVLSVATDINNPLFYVLSTASSYNGLGLPASFTLSASIKETKNFKASLTSTNTPIYVYKELGNLIWSPSKSSFFTSEVEANANIGTLYTTDGTAPYKYELVKPTDANYDKAKGKDNAFFSVQDTAIDIGGKAQVKTIQALTANTYYLQFKVIDSKGNVNYNHTTIEVKLKTQTALEFKDKVGGAIKTEASFTYSASNPSVFAEGGTGSGAIKYSIANKAPDDSVNPQDILTVDENSGVLTLKKVGITYVTATKSGGSDYDDVSVTIPITVTEGPQTIAFDSSIPTKYLLSQGSFDVHAQVSGRETAASTPSGVTYESLSGSVCSVDSAGKVTIKIAGTCEIKASNKDVNYQPVEDTISIKIYDDIKAEFSQSVNPVNVGTTALTAIGLIQNQTGGDGNYTYATSSKIVEVNAAGIVSLTKKLEIDDIKDKWSVDKKQYILNESITMTDGNGYSTEIPVSIVCQGALLEAKFNNANEGTIQETYGLGKSVKLSLTGNMGNGAVTYTKKKDDLGVLSSLINDTVLINKAGDEPAIVEAVIEPKNGYRGQTISVNIKINKATQTVSFEPALSTTMKFEKDKTFTVNAKGQVEGTTISYETSPSNVCTNTNNIITMVGVGKCEITAKGNFENYEEASKTSTITFYNGVAAVFDQNATLLQAKEEADIKPIEVPVGTINTTGGLQELRYAISSSEGDDNEAKDLFRVSGTGNTANMSLKQDIKASELALHGVYDSLNDTYLLKVLVDVFDGSDDIADAEVACVVKIKGASFNPTFTFATTDTNTITKTYGESYFDLSLQGNTGDGKVTYAIANETDMPTDIIRVSGTRVFIDNADVKTPTITADIAAKNGYQKLQISTKVKINKATLDTFNFKDKSEESILLGEGTTVTPTFVGALAGATIELTSEKPEVLKVQGNTLETMAIGTSEVSAKTPSSSDLAYRNYVQKTVTKKYKVYMGLGGGITQTNTTMQVDEDSASQDSYIGYFKYENGNGKITTTITEGADYFYKTDSNQLYLNKNIKREDIKWDADSSQYYIPLQITLQDEALTQVVLDKKITFIGASVPMLTFKDAVDGKISTTYKLNGRYPLNLENYEDETGKALYGPLSYRLKVDDTKPSDVVLDIAKISGIYNVFMGNANTQSVTIEAIIEPGNGYQETIIPCEFEITKAQQNFEFVNTPINFKKGTNFTPQFSAKPKGNGGVVILDSEEKTVVRAEGIKLVGVDTGKSLITATAIGDNNFEDKIVTKEASVYDDLNLEFKQEINLPQADSDSAKKDTKIGTIALPGAIEPTIRLDPTYMDNTFFKIVGSNLTINQDIKASDLASKVWNSEKQAYEMQVEFTYGDKNNSAKTSIQTIYIKGAISNISFKSSDGVATAKIEKPYSKTPFALELKNNSGDTWPYGAITYRLDESTNTTEVLEKIEPNGSVYIKNANLVGNAEKVMAIANVAPANGYEGKEIQCEIFITKALQPDFAFTSSIDLELPGEYTPVYQGLLSKEALTVTIVDQTIATYDKDKKSIIANAAGETKVTATTSASDRNYAVATTPEVDVKVRNIQGYTLQIAVPEPATYGDTSELFATIITDTSKGTEKTQEWFSSREDVASIDKTTGKITVHHVGSTLINVKQTTNLEPEKESMSLWFTVKPKSISVQIANKEKYVGQDVPAFGIETIEGILESDKKNFVEPLYICKDTKGNPVDVYTGVGTYEIEGQFVTNTNSTNKDYDITLLPGVLTIKQDTSLPSWYEVQSETQPVEGWFNKPVTLKLIKADGSYDKISDNMKGPWDETIVVSEEGVQEKDVYFKDTITNKIASPQEEEIKVDETAPRITSVAGKEINTSTTAKFLNMLTLKQFFKPGSEIVITAEDVVPQEGIEVSDIAKIDYKVYKEAEDENGNTLVKEGTVDAREAVVVLYEPDDYLVCATAYDRAGNETKEECQKATVKKIDVDVDGDGKLDFNDSDNDGCPDVNIKWKDKDGNWIVINGDRDYDGIPDLNIDSDGDGNVDLNIDTDQDNLPDLNLVILKKEDWKPVKCVNTQIEEYCTGTTVKPTINIDVDKNKEKLGPELDIDTNGDMKADINISKNGKAAVNIAAHKDWEPKADFTVQKFSYDSDNTLKRYLNIDTSGDGIPDVNVDLNEDGIADLNIDTNGDEIPDVDVDGDGDGERDINIDDDGDGIADREIMDVPEWKPDNTVDVNKDLSYGTITIQRNEYLKDEGFVLRNGNGKKFLPVYALKVVDVTSDKLVALQNYAFKDVEEREPIAVYEMSLLRNEETVPLFTDALIQVPVIEDVKNPKFYLQNAKEEEFLPIEVKQEGDFYTFTTSSLGELAVLGEMQKDSEPPKDSLKDKEDIDLSDHIGGAFGGSKTGDASNVGALLTLLVTSLSVLFFVKKHKEVHK